jgi:hypothetical protein
MAPKSSEDEWLRGLKESAARVEVLRSIRPNAFPQQRRLLDQLDAGILRPMRTSGTWNIYLDLM